MGVFGARSLITRMSSVSVITVAGIFFAMILQKIQLGICRHKKPFAKNFFENIKAHIIIQPKFSWLS